MFIDESALSAVKKKIVFIIKLNVIQKKFNFTY